MAISMQRVEKEFVLKNLRDNEIELTVHVRTQRIPATLSAYNDRTLTISAERTDVFETDTPVNLYFSMNGHLMTFKSKPKEIIDENQVTLSNPEAIYRRLERSFERVRPDGKISVRVYLEDGALELNFPRSESYDPVDEEIELGKQFNPASIASLMKSFRDRASRIAAESKIVMFRARMPSGFAEEVIAKSGKILVLPLPTAERLKGSSVSDRVLTEDEIVALLEEEGYGTTESGNLIQKEHLRLREASIREELYCPILFRNYSIGYMYLLQSYSAEEFSSRTVEFVRQFSRILAYALNVNGYFEGSATPQARPAELIDISASGLLFTVDTDSSNVSQDSDMEMEIETTERTIKATGRVKRIISGNMATYVGVQFTDMSHDDSHYLLTFLYGRDYGGIVDLQDSHSSDAFDGKD